MSIRYDSYIDPGTALRPATSCHMFTQGYLLSVGLAWGSFRTVSTAPFGVVKVCEFRCEFELGRGVEARGVCRLKYLTLLGVACASGFNKTRIKRD